MATISFNEMDVSQAAFDVIAERGRQIDGEGHDPKSDDDNRKGGELATAAACYLLVDFDPESETGWLKRRVVGVINNIWPFAPFWWKPRGKRWNLVRAAALIIAEIERLDRMADGGADGSL